MGFPNRFRRGGHPMPNGMNQIAWDTVLADQIRLNPVTDGQNAIDMLLDGTCRGVSPTCHHWHTDKAFDRARKIARQIGSQQTASRKNNDGQEGLIFQKANQVTCLFWQRFVLGDGSTNHAVVAGKPTVGQPIRRSFRNTGKINATFMQQWTKDFEKRVRSSQLRFAKIGNFHLKSFVLERAHFTLEGIT